MKRFFRSLLAKYMLIIIAALLFIQVAYFIVVILITGISHNLETDYTVEETKYTTIEENWHDEASQLQDVSAASITQFFKDWKADYPDAAMFWVDGDGKLREQLAVDENLPTQWTPSYTAKFIKARYDNNPFTVIAFVGGEDESNGFIVFEIPREVLLTPSQKTFNQYGMVFVIGIAVLVLLFIVISFLFFRSIRKRLLQLQDAMEIRDVDSLPVQIQVRKQDEIGQLEQTFNQMVQELKTSKEREQEEEGLRRELIANLSHDLRTPLTKINAQTFKLAKKELPLDVQQSVQTLTASVQNMDGLIENLMSYTLLMASKYKLERKEMDIIRFTRRYIASWYPAFEKAGFQFEVDMHPFDHQWFVDPNWMHRIYDNLLQNVLRHAANGKYVKMCTQSTDSYDAIVIMDKGNGMNEDSDHKGAGIGLSIVDKMVKGLELEWKIDSSADGTTIKIINCY
ncbi:phosphotransferase RcsD [Paraliobacillus ryukyuensis]|uniref:histidine kinase n=1 Tax=Paraliobacillus ryukyuensis TaxID=200904 RepID=A0A366ED14_9BACI|nr:HAMP domain-containing sensor histidine kinase [Paraliobacillus ryukyuensis]RBP00277.1 signal transduction histidine kinase [Paraliobacillus ryukyuensis]